MSGSRGHILIVEDDADIRESVREVLEAAGYLVSEARNGRIALDLLTAENQEPDLLLLDLHMPDMGGAELVSLLKTYARLSTIPIVIMSAHQPHEEKIPASALAGYLQKPASAEQLLAAVAKCARKSAAA